MLLVHAFICILVPRPHSAACLSVVYTGDAESRFMRRGWRLRLAGANTVRVSIVQSVSAPHAWCMYMCVYCAIRQALALVLLAATGTESGVSPAALAGTVQWQ